MATRTPRHRRNGKIEACEPCRRHKIRCDHGLPACSRCVKKKIRCVYHPAPLTRRPSSSAAETLPPPGPSTSIGTTLDPATTREPRFEPMPVPEALIPDTQDFESSKKSSTGFLGPTSFLELCKRQYETTADETWLEPFRTINPIRLMPITLLSTERVTSSVHILGLLKLLPPLRLSICEYLAHSPTVNAPTLIIMKFMDCLEGLIPRVSTESGAKEVAVRLVQNSHKAIVIDGITTSESFHLQYTGVNLRWEVLAYIFSIAAMTRFVKDTETISGRKKNFVERGQLVFAANRCVSYLDNVEALTDVTIWAQLQNLMLLTFIYGDISHLAWRALNNLTGSIYAMGMHQEPPGEDKLPFFLAQYRKRAFVSTFSLDTSLSTFLGRPSRLQHKYCSQTPQLDLAEDQLVAPLEVRLAAIATLDAAGWNTTGDRHLATRGRLKWITSCLREDAMELCLSVVVEDIESKARAALKRTQDTWAQIPEFLRYSEKVWNTDLDPPTCFSMLFGYLTISYTEFLLHRLIVRHGNTDPGALLHLSQSMLSSLLAITTYRERVSVTSVDYAWVILLYGVPVATLLAMELLKQMESPSPNHPKLPRATILRNISVLLSSFDWIAKPGDGNYDLIQRSKQVLEKILDAILNEQPLNPPSAPASEVLAQQDVHDPIVWMDDFLGDSWALQSTGLDANGFDIDWLTNMDFGVADGSSN